MVNLNAERGGNINNRKRKTRKYKSRRIKTKRVKITKKSATRSFNRKGTKKLRKKRKMKGGDEGDDEEAAEDAKANIKGVFKARFIKQLYKNVLTLCGENTEHLNNDIDVTDDDVTDGDVDNHIAQNGWGRTLIYYNSQQNYSIRDDIKKYLIAEATLKAYTEDRNWLDTGTSNTNCATLNSGKNKDKLPKKKQETYSEQKGSLTIKNRFQTGPILQGLQLEAVNELFNINTDIMPTSEELHTVYLSFIWKEGIKVSSKPPIKYDNDCSCWMKGGENVADIMKKKPSTPTELLKFCIRRINTIFDENIPLDTSDDFASIYNSYVTRIIELYEKNNIKYKNSEVWWRKRVSDKLKDILDTKKKSISNSTEQRRNNFEPSQGLIDYLGM
jgi:hypothetical protein